MSDLNRALVSLDQLQNTIIRYADLLEEALLAKGEGRPEEGPSFDLLGAIKEVLESKQADAIDSIVEGLNGLDENIALAQQKVDKLLVAKAKMDESIRNKEAENSIIESIDWILARCATWTF